MGREEGKRVRRYGEKYIVQTKGRWAGQNIVHQPWQVQLTNELFLRRHDGQRVYKEALIGISRKNGKSTLCAELALYGLMATREHGPEVYAAAGSKDQARIVFNQSKQFVEASPLLMQHLQPQASVITCSANKGVYRVLAADAPLQYGLNPSMVVIDELWVHTNPELYYALTTGQLAREEPLVVSITTAGFDRDTICYELYERGRRLQREGGIEAMREEGFLFWWYEADPRFDYTDQRGWKAANPSDWITVEDLERERKRLPESVFRRLHLNQWTESEDAWIKPWEWDGLLFTTDDETQPDLNDDSPRWWQTTQSIGRSEAFRRYGQQRPLGPKRRPFEKRPSEVDADVAEGLVVLAEPPDALQGLPRAGFIDYSLPTWIGVDVGVRKDTSGIVVAQFHGENLHVRALILDPAEEGKKWGVADIRAALRNEAAKYTALREIAYDPWTFRESPEILAEEGFPMVEFPQSAGRMSPASEGLYELVTTKRLRHEDDERFRKQVLAAVAAPTDRGGWRLSKRKSLERIDATIALAMAADRALAQHLVAPEVNEVGFG